MVTEIMGFLILLGAVIVFLVRWQSKKERQPAELQQDMQYSTYQLKQELERTGSEITSRIEQHVMRLEQLIHEADRSKKLLDGRMAELRELVRLGEEQMDAMHTLRSEIVEARQLRQQLAEAGMQASSMIVGQSAAMERVDAQNFSEVLHQSMARDKRGQEMPAYSAQPDAAPYAYQQRNMEKPLAAGASPRIQEPNDEELAYEEVPPSGKDEIRKEEVMEKPISTESAKARSLLMNGWSVEDVARETGMGKGAVELMKEMLKRQMGDDAVAK